MEQAFDKYFETAILNRDRLSEAVSVINSIFQDYNIMDRIAADDIEFTYHFLTNKHYVEKNEEETVIVKKYRRLTQIIFNYYYPKALGSRFYHYTKLSALNGILKSELKLKPHITNANFDEFKTFYKDHNLIG